MQPAAGGMNQFTRLGDRLDHAGLIVRQGQGRERATVLEGPGLQPVGQPVQVGDSVAIDRPALDGKPRSQGSLHDAGVLCQADQRPAGANGDRAADGQGVGFGPATRESERAFLDANQGRDLGPGALHRGAGGSARGMHGRRVAADAQGAGSGLCRLGADRRGGVVVEIDGGHGVTRRPFRRHAAAPPARRPGRRWRDSRRSAGRFLPTDRGSRSGRRLACSP